MNWRRVSLIMAFAAALLTGGWLVADVSRFFCGTPRPPLLLLQCGVVCALLNTFAIVPLREQQALYGPQDEA